MKKFFSIVLLLLLFASNIATFPLINIICYGVASLFYQLKDRDEGYPLYTIVYRPRNMIISSIIFPFIPTFGMENIFVSFGYCFAELTLTKIAYEQLFVKKYFGNKDNDKKTEIKTSEKTSKKNTNDFLCLACGKKIGCDDTFCKHCGKKIKKVLKYCKYCGNKLNANFECEKCGKKYKNDDFLFVIFFLSLIIIGFALLIYALNS